MTVAAIFEPDTWFLIFGALILIAIGVTSLAVVWFFSLIARNSPGIAGAVLHHYLQERAYEQLPQRAGLHQHVPQMTQPYELPPLPPLRQNARVLQSRVQAASRRLR